MTGLCGSLLSLEMCMVLKFFILWKDANDQGGIVCSVMLYSSRFIVLSSSCLMPVEVLRVGEIGKHLANYLALSKSADTLSWFLKDI